MYFNENLIDSVLTITYVPEVPGYVTYYTNSHLAAQMLLPSSSTILPSVIKTLIPYIRAVQSSALQLLAG